MIPWYTLTLQRPDAEEHTLALIEAGASGIEVLDRARLRCFIAGAQATAAVRCSAREAGYSVVEEADCPAANWVQRSAELWTPISIGRLTITPCGDAHAVRERLARPTNADPDAHDIALILGLGFGTGHQGSTHGTLQLMQHPLIAEAVPSSCLDLGCGSGILAIAAVRLYNAAVTAIDIDAFALENARENIGSNGIAHSVTLHHGEIELAQGKFNLIVVNIYAEVLCALAARLFERLLPNGFLILSGIMAAERMVGDNQRDLATEVRKAFGAYPLTIIDEVESGGWRSILLQREFGEGK